MCHNVSGIYIIHCNMYLHVQLYTVKWHFGTPLLYLTGGYVYTMHRFREYIYTPSYKLWSQLYLTYTCMCACVNCAYMEVHKHAVMLYMCTQLHHNFYVFHLISLTQVRVSKGCKYRLPAYCWYFKSLYFLWLQFTNYSVLLTSN